MNFSRLIMASVICVLLQILFLPGAWAGEKIALKEYALVPVEAVSSGKYIKTEWHAKLQNRAAEPVSFVLTIIFVDENSETIKETKTQGELAASEIKTFSDTVLLESDLATKVASTRVSINELN
jgi:hypothetical protein